MGYLLVGTHQDYLLDDNQPIPAVRLFAANQLGLFFKARNSAFQSLGAVVVVYSLIIITDGSSTDL